jgi:DNA-binding MarR family transcriptional regulator
MENAFTEGERAAWGGLLETFSRLSALIDEDLRTRFAISHVEFEVLLRLAFAEGRRLRIQDLAAQSILTRSGMSRAVERLERAGLVTREAAPEDRRGAYAVLTDVGLARFETAAGAHMVFVRRNFLELFSEAELAQMAGFWERVRGQQTV